MTDLQQTFLIIYALLGSVGVFLAYRKCKLEKDNLGLVGIFVIYGAWVWADLIIFGIFWMIFSLTTILLQDWYLFLFGYCVFWFVRSIVESVYWINQQFSTIIRHSLKEYFFAKIFNNDDYTLWFVMQIFFQCIAAVSAILSVYFGRLWILSL